MTKGALYDILGVDPSASKEEIKRAYRKLAREFHPDSSSEENAKELFQLANEAYVVLSDPHRRRRYDRELGITSQATTRQEASDAYKDALRQTDPLRNRENSRAEDRTEEPIGQRFQKPPKQSKRFSGPQSGKRTTQWPSFFDKLRQDLSGSFLGTGRSKDKHAKKVLQDALRGEREYYFSVDILESLRGTKREVAIDDPSGPRLIRVNIPAGVRDNDTLKVEVPNYGSIRVRIRLTASELLQREGLDLTLSVPVTIREALEGVELEIPTLNGSARVKIPPLDGKSKKLRLKGRGLRLDEEAPAGDLYVKPVIVPPDTSTQAAIEAAKAIDGYYLRDVRSGLPKTLRPENKNGGS